jgi:hypothetical protein
MVNSSSSLAKFPMKILLVGWAIFEVDSLMASVSVERDGSACAINETNDEVFDLKYVSKI